MRVQFIHIQGEGQDKVQQPQRAVNLSEPLHFWYISGVYFLWLGANQTALSPFSGRSHRQVGKKNKFANGDRSEITRSLCGPDPLRLPPSSREGSAGIYKSNSLSLISLKVRWNKTLKFIS